MRPATDSPTPDEGAFRNSLAKVADATPGTEKEKTEQSAKKKQEKGQEDAGRVYMPLLVQLPAVQPAMAPMDAEVAAHLSAGFCRAQDGPTENDDTAVLVAGNISFPTPAESLAAPVVNVDPTDVRANASSVPVGIPDASAKLPVNLPIKAQDAEADSTLHQTAEKAATPNEPLRHGTERNAPVPFAIIAPGSNAKDPPVTKKTQPLSDIREAAKNTDRAMNHIAVTVSDSRSEKRHTATQDETSSDDAGNEAAPIPTAASPMMPASAAASAPLADVALQTAAAATPIVATEQAATSSSQQIAGTVQSHPALVTTASLLQSARLVQSVGQSEMRIAFRSEDLGTVSIHTLASNDLVTARIAVDHAALATMLSGQLPEMHTRLGANHTVEVAMTHASGSATSGESSSHGASGDASAGSSAGGGEEQRRAPPMYRVAMDRAQDNGPVMTLTVRQDAGVRLDVRV